MAGTPTPARTLAPRRLRWSAGALLVLVIVQIYLGALVAGLRAGLIYDTWPLIDGSFIPSAANLLFEQPAWRNVFENTLTVQFDHRMVAYALGVLALAHASDAHRQRSGRGSGQGSDRLATGAGFIAVAVLAQAAIGIMTLIRGVPIELALLHQATALVVLTAATLHAARALSPPQLAPRRRCTMRTCATWRDASVTGHSVIRVTRS